MAEAEDKLSKLQALRSSVEQCARCSLRSSRTKVVFGAGGTKSGLMLVGEAPGYHEDQQGLPFVGRAGKLLTSLLEGIGLSRDDVYIANVLKCRPPDNRDPQAEEIDSCRDWLEEQISIIQPKVICSLGNFATKLLSGSQAGITSVHGIAQEMHGQHGDRYLFPVFHPAAALYTSANLKALERDFDCLPGMLGLEAASQEKGLAAAADPGTEPDQNTEPEQLDLF